jgi:hypothetical protein
LRIRWSSDSGKAFNLTKEEIEKTAPLYEHKDKLVLVIQFESEIAGKK